MSSGSSSSRQPPGQPAATTTVKPPEWHEPYHRTADLGYPDFHPPRPGQEEDSMAEGFVKSGYVARPIVQTDNFTVHEMIHDTWEKMDQAVLRQLGELFTHISARRTAAIPSIGPTTFRHPERRALPRSAVQSWIAELANPDIPLSKLSKIIPAIGRHELLETLESNKVPTSRAVWLIRTFGALDMHNMSRSKNPANSSQLAVEWATLIINLLKRHFNDIGVPRPQTGPPSSIRSTFRRTLGEPELREKWLYKFTYTMELVHEMYGEGMIDHATWLLFIANQISSSNIPQLGFMARVAEEYLDGLLQHRGFLRPLISGLVEKLVEIAKIPQAERGVVSQLSLTVGGLLQQILIAMPDAFVYPRIWKDRTNQRLLQHVFVHGAREIIQVPEENPVAKQVYDGLAANYEKVQKRNYALLFTTLPTRNSFAMRVAMADIQLLNSIGRETDVHSLKYFADSPSTDQINGIDSTFRMKLKNLLTWSVSQSQYGDHRPYVAVTLVSLWRDEAKLRAVRRRTDKPDALLQEALFEWFDEERGELEGVAMLFGEMCRKGLLSYSWFLRRLMARGEAGIGYEEGAEPSHLITVLAVLPVPSTSLLSERYAALYGPSNASSKDPVPKRVKRELKNALPVVFGLEDAGPIAPLSHSAPAFLRHSYFERHYTVVHWLLPTLNEQLAKGTLDLLAHVPTYCNLMEVMRIAKCYSQMLDLNTRLLRDVQIEEAIRPLLDTLGRHAEIWVSMDAMGNLGEMLFTTHRRFQSIQRDSRIILEQLVRKEMLGQLSRETRMQVDTDIRMITQRPAAPLNPTIPPMIPEIIDLAQTNDPQHAYALAYRLWSAYGDQAAAIAAVWDNTVQGVRQHATTEVLSDFILAYSWRLPLDSPLDNHINQWFRGGNGREEFSELDENAWRAMTPFLLRLIMDGCLSASTTLENVAYVAWKQAATLEERSKAAEVFLRAANTLTKRLLLVDAPEVETLGEMDEGSAIGQNTLAPVDLREIQRFQTQRHRVYSSAGIKQLFKAVRNLVYLEANPHLSDEVREEAEQVRTALCKHYDFRTTAFKHLGELKDIFVRPLNTERDVRLAEALRSIIHVEDDSAVDKGSSSEPSSQWKAIFSQLNAWGFSRASIELRLTLERMGSGLESSDKTAKGKAERDIRDFMTGLFARNMDPEETDLTADVLKGIEGGVANQFLNHGVQRLADHLDSLNAAPLTSESIMPFLNASGEILRLLASVTIPSLSSDEWTPEWTPLIFEELVIDGFMQSALKALQAAKEPLAPAFVGEKVTELGESYPLSELLVLLSKMVQFVLRFDGVWTTRVKGMAEQIISALIRPAVALGCSSTHHDAVFTVLIDTASYVMDELPHDPKLPQIDLVRPPKPDSLPTRIPHHLREKLLPLCTYVSKNKYVDGLYHTYNASDVTFSGASASFADPEATHYLGPPVRAQPWEWTDYTEEPNPEDPSAGSKNDTSISLEYFNARPTGERVNVDGSETWEQRVMRDHLRRETIYERDWKETRMPFPMPEDPESSESEEEIALAGISRRRTPGSVNSVVASPAVEREVIDVDALPETSGSGRVSRKRKPATMNTVSSLGSGAGTSIDDDIEIIEPAVAAASTRGRRGRGRPPGTSTRARGKKKA